MTTEKIKSANEVITDFLEVQLEDDALDSSTVSVITDLRGEAKLTKTNLLRRLEEKRKVACAEDNVTREES